MNEDKDLFQFGNTIFFQKNYDKFKIDVLQISSTNYIRGCLSKWSDVGGWLFVCENELEANEDGAKEITIKMLKECANQFLTPIQYDDEYYENYEYYQDYEENEDDEENGYFESMSDDDDDDDENFPF